MSGNLLESPFYQRSLFLFQNEKQKEAVELMLEVCKKWMKSGNPEELIRAARHYERASQIVIAQQVCASMGAFFFFIDSN